MMVTIIEAMQNSLLWLMFINYFLYGQQFASVMTRAYNLKTTHGVDTSAKEIYYSIDVSKWNDTN